MVTHIINNRL